MCTTDCRSYQCALCHSQVHICRRCDRGHIYCPTCAPLARRASIRRAKKRYRQSRRGRFHHAKRQQRYRARKINKVTDHSSPLLAQKSYSALSQKIEFCKKVEPMGRPYCHFCAATGSLFLRRGFLKHRKARLRTKKCAHSLRLNE